MKTQAVICDLGGTLIDRYSLSSLIRLHETAAVRRPVAVIYDLGGTLVDRYSLSPLKALQFAFKKHNYYLTPSQINLYMGLSKPQHISAVVRDYYREAHRTTLDIDLPLKIAPIYADFKQEQRRLLEAGIDILPGVRHTYEYLREKDIKVAVTTGYSTDETNLIIQHLAREGMTFDSVVSSNEVINSRPCPDMVLKTMENLGIDEMSSPYVLKIDDSLYGLREGIRGGCLAVGVARYSCMMNVNSLSNVHGEIDDEIERRCETVKTMMIEMGAHYAIDSMDCLPDLLESL